MVVVKILDKSVMQFSIKNVRAVFFTELNMVKIYSNDVPVDTFDVSGQTLSEFCRILNIYVVDNG